MQMNDFRGLNIDEANFGFSTAFTLIRLSVLSLYFVFEAAEF